MLIKYVHYVRNWYLEQDQHHSCFKKHIHEICELADPTKFAVQLYSSGFIAEGTKDKAIQVMGVDNYQKNAEVLREVEKVIKQDKDKLPDFCKILWTMPTLKHIGDQILQEIGCPVTTTPPLPVPSPTAKQHCDTTIEVMPQDIVMTEIERLHKNYCKLYLNAVRELQRFCQEKKDNLQDIAIFATPLTSADVKLTDSTDINDLFQKLNPYYDFIDCDVIKDILTEFIPESTITNDVVKHIEDAENFKNSQPISILLEDLKKVRLHKQRDSDTHMAPITIKISRKWREKHIKNLGILIDHLLPQPYPKMSLFKYITIERSSVYIQYLVLQSYVEATISHAKQHLRFMSYIGIYNLVIDGTILVQSDENLDFSFDESLLTAISAGSIETVEFLLSIGANISYQCKKSLIYYCENGQYHVAKIADTPLMIACRNGYHQIAELLLYNNVDPKIQKHNGFTALMLACQNGHYQVAELLLNNNVDRNINIQKKDGWTALMLACLNGYYQIAELLLNNNADPNIQGEAGETALMSACVNGYCQVAKLLLKKNVNPNIQKKDGGTALMIACLNGHYQVAELLLNNPNIQKKDGWTALMSACQNGHYQVAELLLNNNVDPNIQKKDGWTALMGACLNGHCQVAKLLLSKNADPIIQDEDGWTALMIACQNGHYQVAELLLNNNVDPNIQKKDGWTALMLACLNGHYQVAELLLNNNADPSIQGEAGETALMSACVNGYCQVAKLLLKKNVNPNIQKKDGGTALMIACLNGHYQVAELLLNNPNIQKKDGWTALMSACQNGHYQVAELLLNNNVDPNIQKKMDGQH